MFMLYDADYINAPSNCSFPHKTEVAEATGLAAAVSISFGDNPPTGVIFGSMDYDVITSVAMDIVGGSTHGSNTSVCCLRMLKAPSHSFDR